uniref:Uncharacterized protein n=1 Tax=Pyrodinium bahamense TaxID=73915 RepID=A0A7S0AN47_9DINO
MAAASSVAGRLLKAAIVLALAASPTADAGAIVLSSESLDGSGFGSQHSADVGKWTVGGSRRFDEGRYMENTIISSLNNCPLCRNKEPCLLNCKQKEQRSWDECLQRCLGDNPMLLSVFQGIVQSTSRRLKGFGQ